ncbi:MAG TPA: hypothetical protein VES40_06090 [Ilumatobacteraceae bacterium]|nr:hypothetical protein [Ilumatobacteraceae bacterium]
MKLRNIVILATLALTASVSAQATNATAAASNAAAQPAATSKVIDGTSNTLAYGHRTTSYTFNDFLISS